MASILKGIRAAFGDVEMTPYTVLVEREGYEERLYPARKWACTTMKGTSQQELMTPMFRILFTYISGKNSPNVRVDMTSPVTTYIEPGPSPSSAATMTMAFLVPADHQHEPPDPGTKNIFIEDRPSMVVLVRRFGGYLTDEVLTKEVKALTESVKKQDEKGVIFDKFYVVGYDPPFKLIGRRNEIWFVKTTPEEEKGSKEEKGSEEEKESARVNWVGQVNEGWRGGGEENERRVEEEVRANEENKRKEDEKGSTEVGQKGA